MPWLVSEAKVMASLEVADSWRTRRRGLLGRSDFDGALVISPTRSIHTLGMKFALDVAFCDKDLVVLAVKRVNPHRLPLPPLATRAVIEATAGSFERWGLTVGDCLEIRS